MRKIVLALAILIPLACLGAVIGYNLPPIHDRLAWRVDEWQSRLKYAIDPPEKAVFVPKDQKSTEIPAPGEPTASPTIVSTATPTLPGFTPTPLPSATPTETPAPLPDKARLTGIVHEYQLWNNCGPANLAMDLSYWGWQGDQKDTAAFLKPNERDKNVMPYEMQAFVQQDTGLKALVRMGGDDQILKRFIAEGFPVIVEKGFEGVSFDGWMGHYEVVNGYDDAKNVYIVQDSYNGPNLPVGYDKMESAWRAFNFLYIIVYPPEREAEVMKILGPQADSTANYQYAAQKASDETSSLKGRDLYFAWYNRGTSLMYLQDYAGAAQAYDQAFAVYPSIAEKQRPWRMLWYQTGPYFAYFYAQRYNDVIDLATTTLDKMSEPILEESFYWRGRAEAALGDTSEAIQDYQASLKVHPGFGPSLEQLQTMGVQP
jgi:tetratricopeptide (TPR) repeat protein